MTAVRHGREGRAAYISGWRWRFGVTVLVLGTWGVTLGLPKSPDNSSWSPVGVFSYGWNV